MGPDFSKEATSTLGKRAGFRCSNPDCNTQTVGPHSDDTKAIVIGEAAHIYGARPNAKRYRAEMSDAARASIANGIWLCRSCHGLIDRDEIAYSAGVLMNWKWAHESNILELLGTPGEKAKSAAIELDISKYKDIPPFCKEIIRSKPGYWEYILTAELIDCKLQPILRAMNDISRGASIFSRKAISITDAVDWFQVKLTDLQQVPTALFAIIDDINRSWAPLGTPGNVDEIVRSCDLFANIGDFLLNMAKETSSMHFPAEFTELKGLFIEGVSHMTHRLMEISAWLKEIISQEPRSGTFTFTLVLDFPEGWSERMTTACEHAIEQITS